MDTKPADTVTRTYDRKPLAVVHNLPGQKAEVWPGQLPNLVWASNAAANRCDPLQVTYPLALGRTHEHELKPGVAT